MNKLKSKNLTTTTLKTKSLILDAAPRLNASNANNNNNSLNIANI